MIPVFKWDEEADAGYVDFYPGTPVERTEQVFPAVNIDYDKAGRIVGVEIFGEVGDGKQTQGTG